MPSDRMLDDEDPLVELRQYRKTLSSRFKTIKALGDYLRSVPSAKAMLAEIERRPKKPIQPGKHRGSRRRKHLAGVE